MAATESGAQVQAGTQLTGLTTGLTFAEPSVTLTSAIYNVPASTGPLYDSVTKLDINDLTSGAVNGSGAFDKIMTSLVAHLKVEYEASRFSGAEYTKAYLGVVQAALGASTQFLLARDTTYWLALLVQAQAKAADVQIATARVELETARAGLIKMQWDAVTAQVNYGLTKMKIATEDVTYAN